jgi:hypothetical protein
MLQDKLQCVAFGSAKVRGFRSQALRYRAQIRPFGLLPLSRGLFLGMLAPAIAIFLQS